MPNQACYVTPQNGEMAIRNFDDRAWALVPKRQSQSE